MLPRPMSFWTLAGRPSSAHYIWDKREKNQFVQEGKTQFSAGDHPSWSPHRAQALPPEELLHFPNAPFLGRTGYCIRGSLHIWGQHVAPPRCSQRCSEQDLAGRPGYPEHARAHWASTHLVAPTPVLLVLPHPLWSPRPCPSSPFAPPRPPWPLLSFLEAGGRTGVLTGGGWNGHSGPATCGAALDSRGLGFRCPDLKGG